MAQVKIKFVQDYEIQDEHRGTDKATRYRKGQTLSCSEASARHFVESKDVAERVGKRQPKKPDTGLPGSRGQTTEKAKPQESLLGSSTHPPEIEIGEATITLGDIVNAAFEASGLTVEQWNKLVDANREEMIQAQIDGAREAATAP